MISGDGMLTSNRAEIHGRKLRLAHENRQNALEDLSPLPTLPITPFER
jgi:hypothetical protein